MSTLQAGRILPIALALLMAGAGLAVLPAPLHAGAPTAARASAAGIAPTTTHAAAVPAPDPAAQLLAMEHALAARGVPADALHPPRWQRSSGPNAPVAPTYTTGPAPMGLSDLGLRNASGTLVPYDYNTSGVWGSVTLTKAVAAYVDGDGPDTFGIQLNAVATNVTLFGQPGFQFWTQDYLSYTASTGNLTFGDNVWNFSSRYAPFSANTLSSFGPAGHPEPPYYYFAVGPSYTIAYPFTVNLYLNASHVGPRPAVYFNYSLSKGGAPVVPGGSFDVVVFNSTLGASVTPAPTPAFQVNGTGLGPSGLPNDFELVLVGNDIGDTTTFFAISGSMSLAYWNASRDRYRSVPAAFDAGSETGETSTGLLPVTNLTLLGASPNATLRIGPSFVSGLWNVSRALNGAREFRVNQHPQNAFLFVNPGGTFNASTAEWVPTQHFGTPVSVFWIPNTGTYTLQWMLSDRTEATVVATILTSLPNSTTSFVEHLGVSAAAGSYTPLFAWGNGDLAAVSQRGNGTFAAPYVLVHHPVGPLNPVFGQLNDFGFPVFAGILLINTTAYVHIVQPPLGVTYGAWEASGLAFLHLPNTNQMQIELWNVSNTVVANSSSLGGWLTANFGFFPAGAIVLWGSTGNLIANDTFYDQGSAIALYGGSHNTLWGNRFLPGAVSAFYYEGNNTTGILESESGDLVYNNYFAVGQPAITPTLDPYSCQVLCVSATYTDAWNVSLAPANASRAVLGYVLTGSILRTWYQGGNYWSNYGNATNPLGVLPYNDSGLITTGGDYHPLVASAIFAVTFTALHLVPGSAWGVTVAGSTVSSTSGTLTLYEPNGSYGYSVVAPTTFVGPAPGVVTVAGAAVAVALNFTELFGVSVSEVGLVLGWQWNVSFVNVTPNGTTVSSISHTASASVALANGTYQITPTAYGYSVTSGPSLGRFVVRGSPTAFSLTFSLLPLLAVSASGLPANAPWTVTVTQGSSSTSLTGVGDEPIVFTAFELQPGSYTWSVAASGYTASPSSGSGSAPTPVAPSVTFASSGPAASSGPSVDPWEIAFVGALVAAAVGFALAVLAFRRRPRPPAPIAPAAVAQAPTTPGAPAPWEEGAADSENPPPYTSRR